MKFDLEKASAGQMVMLRNDLRALVFAPARKDLPEDFRRHVRSSHQIFGICEHGQLHSWDAEGRSNTGGFGADIVGMAPPTSFEHWAFLHPIWRYIAADNDGDAYLFQSSPVKNKEEGIWETTDGIQRCVEGLFDFKYLDWETSLVERPA